MGLTDEQVAGFIADGFVRLDNAFSAQTAAEARALIWQVAGTDPDRPETWPGPVQRLGELGGPAIREAAGSPVLAAACNALIGSGRWLPRTTLGTFVIRFPSSEAPIDTGWHVDMSLGYDHPDFMEWRANWRSDGRALLMLFLFTDTGPDDAPTLIRAGSHRQIARQLAPAGEAGLTLREVAADGFASTADCEEVRATGTAGTVYLCHPFLVHSAQAHRGAAPRIIAQPPLLPAGRPWLASGASHLNAAERAIIAALESPQA